MTAEPVSSAPSATTASGGIRPFAVMTGYCLLVLIGLCVGTLPFATDYVGADNDDVMRLVEVRDYLAGQGWFDMMQYRLGLVPGTLMHWSRLVDWPIASLIRLAGLWFPPHTAEAIALAIWPLAWALPVLLSSGYAGLRLGGRVTMHVVLGLTALYLLTSNRFLPGAIDHHNVQIAIIAFLTAVLATARAWRWFAAAGMAAALALAIGAETTPLIATACMIVALLWAFHGAPMRTCTMAYCLSLALMVTVLFAATVPPQSYRVVTCDNLSFGYYSLTAIGGGLLFSAAAFASRLATGLRFALLAVIGGSVGLSALILAPQCLGNPLANLDPMLVTLWLNNVGEARSVFAMVRQEPGTVAGFYVVGLIGLIVCAARIWRREQVEAHLVIGLLLATSFATALIQVRGAMFSNLIPPLPLALLIADLREKTQRPAAGIRESLVYSAAILMSVPSLWAVAGTALVQGSLRLKPQIASGTGSTAGSAAGSGINCATPQALAPLKALSPATVAASSELGTAILRFTHHRVLTAPYHRNQAGMLTELHIGLSVPSDARAFLAGANVGFVAFCPSDPQTRELIKLKPDGFYGALDRGNPPDYLELSGSGTETGLWIYRVK